MAHTHIKNLLPLFRADCSAVWDDTLQASDASTTGLGVCSSGAGAGIAGKLGRASEKWRYRIEDSIHARRSALGIPRANPHDLSLLSVLDPGIG